MAYGERGKVADLVGGEYFEKLGFLVTQFMGVVAKGSRDGTAGVPYRDTAGGLYWFGELSGKYGRLKHPYYRRNGEWARQGVQLVTTAFDLNLEPNEAWRDGMSEEEKDKRDKVLVANRNGEAVRDINKLVREGRLDEVDWSHGQPLSSMLRYRNKRAMDLWEDLSSGNLGDLRETVKEVLKHETESTKNAFMKKIRGA